MANLSHHQIEKLVSKIEQFIIDHRIECPETIYQTDRVAENSLELIESCCEIVGYLEPNED